MKQSHKTLLLWVLLILMFVAIWNLVSGDETPRTVAFSEFITDVRSGNVERVEVEPRENSGQYTYWLRATEEAAAAPANARSPSGSSGSASTTCSSKATSRRLPTFRKTRTGSSRAFS